MLILAKQKRLFRNKSLKMKALLISILFCINCAHAQIPSDSAQVKQNPYFQVHTHAEFMSLLLVSPTLYKNWGKQRAFFREKYKDQNILLLISAKVSQQKIEFLKTLKAEQKTGKDLFTAYADALRTITEKYELLDFRHYLYLKE